PFFDIRSLRIEQGRAFAPREVQAGVAVVVLGHELAEKLFEARDPIGQEVKLYDMPYRVIGVVEKQGNLFGLSLDKFAVAPAAAQPPAVRRRGDDAGHGRGDGRRRHGQRARRRGRRHHPPARGRGSLVDPRGGHPGRGRGHRGRRLSSEPRGAPRSDRSVATRDMTSLFEGVGIALASLLAHKGRAALTILGVAIGVTVVMVIAAMISGINQSVSNLFQSLAPQSFLVWRFFQAGVNVSDGSDEASPWRRNPTIREIEADRIAVLPSVRYVTRRDESSATVEFGDV